MEVATGDGQRREHGGLLHARLVSGHPKCDILVATPGQKTNGGQGWTQLWRVDADGKNPRLVYAKDERHAYGSFVSPDAKYVIFTGNIEEDGDPEHEGGPMSLMHLSDAPIIEGHSPGVPHCIRRRKTARFSTCRVAGSLAGLTMRFRQERRDQDHELPVVSSTSSVPHPPKNRVPQRWRERSMTWDGSDLARWVRQATGISTSCGPMGPVVEAHGHAAIQ